MADNQDNLSQSDQQKLTALEQQLSQEKVKGASSAGQSATAKDSLPPFSKREAYSAKPATGSKTALLWFFTLLNLCVLSAVLAAAYVGWLQWQKQQQSQTDFIHSQESSFARQRQQLNDTLSASQLDKEQWQAQSRAMQAQIDGLQASDEQHSQQIANNDLRLTEMAGRRPADWLLAEADFLLKMAGRKLWLEHDTATALLMLQAADGRLADLADPSLLPVREKLAADINSLQQVNPVPTTDIALKLSGMIQQVDNLPLAFFKRPQRATPAEALSDDSNDWLANLTKNIKEVLRDFFTIDKSRTEVKPFMSDQQQWLSREQLKFSLQSAQIAALKENAALYQDSLQQAGAQLSEFFDGKSSAVEGFTQQLDTLQNIDVAKQIPQQFSAANALQDVVSQRLGKQFANGDRSL